VDQPPRELRPERAADVGRARGYALEERARVRVEIVRLPSCAVGVEAPREDLAGVSDEVERGVAGGRGRPHAMTAGGHSAEAAHRLGGELAPGLAEIVDDARVPEVRVEDDERARLARRALALRLPARPQDDDQDREA